MTQKIKILVVEDEIMIAEDITSRLTDMGYQVAATFDNVDDAVTFLTQNPIDILLLDISLKGNKTGLDLAGMVNEQFHIPFIFLTSLANAQVVEQAKQVNPAAYLLKPFNDRQISIAIEMALFNFYGNPQLSTSAKTDQASSNQRQAANSDCLFFKKGTHYQKVALQNILWLQAESNYTTIFTETEKYTYSCVLKHFEDKLPADQFVRVHRSYIVNICNVSGLEGNSLLVGKKRIPVSKTFSNHIFDQFKTL